MRLTSFYRTKMSRLLFSVMAGLLIFAAVAQAQQTPRQLGLADILIGLRSSKATLAERNKILSEAVIERGITFALTAEIENELFKTGAGRELLDAIRQKSPIIKTSAVTDVPTVQPKPVVKESLPDFSFYQKRADDNIGKGEYDLAIVDYNKAVELNPKSVPAYFNRGRAFYFKRDFSSAIESYSKVIELTPNDSIVFYNRGVSYEKMGNTAKSGGRLSKSGRTRREQHAGKGKSEKDERCRTSESSNAARRTEKA